MWIVCPLGYVVVGWTRISCDTSRLSRTAQTQASSFPPRGGWNRASKAMTIATPVCLWVNVQRLYVYFPGRPEYDAALQRIYHDVFQCFDIKFQRLLGRSGSPTAVGERGKTELSPTRKLSTRLRLGRPKGILRAGVSDTRS